MQNNIKKFVFGLCLCCLGAVVPASLSWGTTVVPPAATLSCGRPSVSQIGQGSNYFSFGIETSEGSNACQYWYVRKDNNSDSSTMTTTASNVTVSGLAPGTYTFYFQGVCGNEVSEYIILDDLIIF